MDSNYEFKSRFNEGYSLVARRILRMLSYDSRASDTSLAKQLGVTRQAVAKRRLRLEKELGISYTLELDEGAMGLVYPHIIMVRFGLGPDYARVSALLKESHVPQFAATLRGGYDMLIYATAASRREYTHWDKGMQALLSDYEVSWYPSEVAYRQLGFFPIRNEAIDRVDIGKRHREILKLLNLNSRMSFRSMSERMGVNFNILRYDFKKLLGTGYIKRFTIVERPPEGTVMMYYFAKLTLTNAFERCAAEARKALMYDDEHPLVSRYSFCSQLIGSGDFFVMGAFDNRGIGYSGGVLHYKNAMRTQRIRIRYGAIDKVLLGSMPLRSVDDRKEYSVLKWTPEMSIG